MILFAFVSSSLGHAAGFYTTTSGAKALGRGGAYTAGVDDLSAQFHNPAGLVRIDGPQIMLDMSWVDNGPAWVGVLLRDADAVLALEPEFTALRLADRVRATFRVGSAMAIGFMLVFTIICRIWPEAMIRVFSKDPAVLAVGGVYLRIVALNFVASGIIFVSSSILA